MYIAELHKGEMVLTRGESDKYRSGSQASTYAKLSKAINVDDLVNKMSAAISSEIASVSANIARQTLARVTTNNSTTTTNNTSNMPINNYIYGAEKVDKNFGRELGEQVNKRLRGRGIVGV